MEYRIFRRSLEDMDTCEKQERYLNDLGGDGWICFRIAVRAVGDGGNDYWFYCRRGDEG